MKMGNFIYLLFPLGSLITRLQKRGLTKTGEEEAEAPGGGCKGTEPPCVGLGKFGTSELNIFTHINRKSFDPFFCYVEPIKRAISFIL